MHEEAKCAVAHEHSSTFATKSESKRSPLIVIFRIVVMSACPHEYLGPLWWTQLHA